MTRVQISRRGRGTVARIVDTPEFDVYNLADIKTPIQEALKERPAIFVLDMSMVESIDSSGIGVIVTTNITVNAYEGLFCLAAPSEQVHKVLEQTLLHRNLNIFKDADEAMRYGLEQRPE